MNDLAASRAPRSTSAATPRGGTARDESRCPRSELDADSRSARFTPSGVHALQLVSVNHRTAPIDVLERVALSPAEACLLLERLKHAGIQAVAVATCNRTELYWVPSRPGDAHTVALAMTQAWNEPPLDFHRYALELQGVVAAQHLFRVAAGLESLMLGESEILGQLRAALELAEAQATAGPLLAELFRSALRFGRRARANTGIGAGAMSVASAAVHALHRAQGDLSGVTVVVLGAGHTGFKAAQHLRAEGVGRLVLVNRTASRARDAANRLGAESAPLEDLGRQMAIADALVTAVQAPQPIVDGRLVRFATADRARPLILVDLSLPRAVAPDVEQIPGVSVIDLSRLEHVVVTSRARRTQEIPRVEALLKTALEEFEQRALEAVARPLVAELRVRAEAIRRDEVAHAVAAGLGDPATLNHVTRRLVDHLLRAPSASLRRGSYISGGGRASCLECVFGVVHGGVDGCD